VPNDVIATCPVCSHELSITRLHSDHCATTLEGDFSVGRFGRLSREQLALLESFLRSRGNLRDIERTTRQRIPVAPLPADFATAAEAFKRLKPAPRDARPARSHHVSTKADRRVDGQRRQDRNERQQRHPHRADGHHAHRPEGGQPKRKFRGRRHFGGPRRAEG
jgi:ATP-dependent RNA helicase RhlE